MTKFDTKALLKLWKLDKLQAFDVATVMQFFAPKARRR
jgi:hypothetical protein